MSQRANIGAGVNMRYIQTRMTMVARTKSIKFKLKLLSRNYENLTLATTKDVGRDLRMPRPRAVEVHAGN